MSPVDRASTLSLGQSMSSTRERVHESTKIDLLNAFSCGPCLLHNCFAAAPNSSKQAANNLNMHANRETDFYMIIAVVVNCNQGSTHVHKIIVYTELVNQGGLTMNRLICSACH